MTITHGSNLLHKDIPVLCTAPSASRGGLHPDGVGCLHPGEGLGGLCPGAVESVSRVGRVCIQRGWGVCVQGEGDLYPEGEGCVSRGKGGGEIRIQGGLGRAVCLQEGQTTSPPPVIFHPASCMDQWPQIFNRNIGYFIFLCVGGNENHQTLPRRGRRRNRYGARSSFRSSGRTTTGSHKLLPVPKSSQ